MVMKISVNFDKPLNKEDKIKISVAISSLAKSDRIKFDKSGYEFTIFGEAMSRKRVESELKDAGIKPREIITSLHEEEDSLADDTEKTSTKERYKAIGR